MSLQSRGRQPRALVGFNRSDPGAPLQPARRRLISLLAGAAALWPVSGYADRLGERRTLHLGVVGERVNQPDYVLAQYQPLLDYLRRELAPQGIALGELQIAENLAELAGFVRAGKVDVILESLISTFRINAGEALVRPVLAAWRKGQRETRTLFFVRQNSQIKQLRDLAGKTLALESTRSTTAYALPRIVLRQHGLDVQPLGSSHGGPHSVRCVLANAELNQAYWVDRGQADAAAFNTEDWDALPIGLRQELRVIHSTDPILRWLLSARIGLSSVALAAVQAALLDMSASAEGLRVLQQIGRIRRFDRLSADDLASIKHWRDVAARSEFGE